MISIVDGSAGTQVETTARTVGEALWEAGYRLYRADETLPALDSPLTPSLTITIHRARLAMRERLEAFFQRAQNGASLSQAGRASPG